MNLRKVLLYVFPWLALLVVSGILYKQCSKPDNFVLEEDKVIVSHQTIIEKIEAIGKLELVKYRIKDIVEQTTEMDWWPDPKVVLMVSGEAVGCINLASIDSNDVSITNEEITLILPSPELCYFKVDHKESKVYNIEDKFIGEAKLVDKAYRQAEAQIKTTAIKMGILEETKKNAEKILKPLLEDFSGKKVTLVFK